METAKQIRSQLSALGISVQELAKRTGLSYQKLWNKLNGRTAITSGDVAIIANAIGQDDVVRKPLISARGDKRFSQAGKLPARRSSSGTMDARGRRFAIIVSRWNEFVTREMLEGALDELRRHGDPDTDIVRVPGTWEIPVAAKALLDAGPRPEAVIALGCIMQGHTAHAGILGGDVGSALMGLQVQSGVPIAWGILTPDDQDQALERAGLKMGNKGREAALAAIEMASLIEQLS